MLRQLFCSTHAPSTPPKPLLASIRPARTGDAWELDHLDRYAFPHDYRPHDWWLKAVAQHGRAVWAAELDGVLVGFAVAEDRGCALHLRALAVASTHHRRGIGRQLVHAAIHQAHTVTRSGRMRAAVREGNLAGQLFLRASGFRCVSIDRQSAPEPEYLFTRAGAGLESVGRWNCPAKAEDVP